MACLPFSPLCSSGALLSSRIPPLARRPNASPLSFQGLGHSSKCDEWAYSNPAFRSSGLKSWGSRWKQGRNALLSNALQHSEAGLGTETPDSDNNADDLQVKPALLGEDAAIFDPSKQKLSSWIYFTIILATVLTILNYIWINSKTGFGAAFIEAISSLSDNHEVIMLILLLIFAFVHSGLASMRDLGEKVIGERAYRVFFAGFSLPLAISAMVYFIDHRYDGIQLWQVRGIPGMHELVWAMSFISFFFLYPSTFNLLEVAAVDKPKMHLYETGIVRITRHPQMFGQFLWCVAHTLWIGNSFMVTTSVGLLAHHLFGAWNGDRRLAIRHGEAFEAVKDRTSIVPFAAILDGRQSLPKDFYKEFLRLPYLVILALTVGAYVLHPMFQEAHVIT